MTQPTLSNPILPDAGVHGASVNRATTGTPLASSRGRAGASPVRSRGARAMSSLVELVREAVDEVRGLDLGLTAEHRRSLARMGLGVGGLALLVAMAVGVRVANDRLEVANRRAALQVATLRDEGDRLRLEVQSRRGEPQMAAVISALNLTPAPELEVGADGRMLRARMAPALVAPVTAPPAAPAPVSGAPAVSPPTGTASDDGVVAAAGRTP